MAFLLLIFKLTLGCFSLSSRLFRYQITLLVAVCFYIYLFIYFLFFAFLCVCAFDREVHLYF